ncbi:MAG: GTP-binding protein TypA [Elusimicrobia bacterium GWA2_56_46]|nr:MAG: GTP-binding protein TypA [Elusimicrobia bacterium GWA2_56_46]OGR54891.1 MAG: GTP-binding protein TypA [Elusimicrobia bacterium GWC2_56_31]HBW23313.1 translational GTPase TypA [Elusimicrobiota bacterium]
MQQDNAKRRQDLRNIAIIAHVDHGKTTLVDAMLRQTGAFTDKSGESRECIMDSNDLERERGITILSKNTSVKYGETTIHIVDTPGHADFGSEVERVLRMVDGVLLLVDALDGPMPQTRFVLKKALALGLRPIVVINKVDRPNCDPHAALDKVFSLFMELGASDHQLDFPTVYAVGRDGWASRDYNVKANDLSYLFDTIIKYVPGPLDKDSEPLRMLVTMLDYSSYTGRIGIGRIFQGKVATGQMISLASPASQPVTRKVVQLMGFKGLTRTAVQSARSGDIVAMAGLEGIEVGDTVSSAENPGVLPGLEIELPTLSMEFYANDGPFSGRDGKFVTITQLRERLYREQQINVGLKVEDIPGQAGFKVSGRGELHLSILIETMRREGYELCVSKMAVITHQENGVTVEPVEYLVLDAPTEFQGVTMEALGRRGAQMKDMKVCDDGRVRFEYVVSSRALIGFKSEFMTLTKGSGLMHHNFHGFMPEGGFQPPQRNGVFIAKESGKTAGYALNGLQDHGIMFISPNQDVYSGQIVGEHCRSNDLVVNPCKEKKQTNMRSSTSDMSITLTPPLNMSLEQAIEYVEEDEFVEVTPKSLRLRKKVLDHSLRKRGEKEYF